MQVLIIINITIEMLNKDTDWLTMFIHVHDMNAHTGKS